MSKQYYLRNKSLHGLPKMSSKAKCVQVANGGSINILFIIPIIITIQGHIFEMYSIVSEIYDNIDLVPRVKNLLQLEGEIRTRELTFDFKNRAVSIIPEHKE